ncbi:hypothetical protein ACFWQC_24030 [Nocardioides sp. NPDC058538]|uniref:hypothetical protein n=1 Tax=Nocardioides sp. NPDC058538 TaxID=3346542 RepID=UPI00364FE7C8
MSDAVDMSSIESARRSRRTWPYVLLAVLFGIGALMLWAWLALLVAADREGCRYSPASVYVSRSFPPQGWCIEQGVATATIPIRNGLELVTLLTATLLCASLAVMLGRTRGPTIWTPANRIALVLILIAGATGAVMAARDEPARAAIRASVATAAEHARQQASHLDGPSPGPTPTPADVRKQLEVLAADAMKAVPTGTLWPVRPQVVSSPCGGGQVLSLTGRFTTRDFATARDDADFNSILHANEEASAAIVEAWTGPSGTYDMMKGEYYVAFVAYPHLSAHLGHEERIGEIEVTSLCAHP